MNASCEFRDGIRRKLEHLQEHCLQNVRWKSKWKYKHSDTWYFCLYLVPRAVMIWWSQREIWNNTLCSFGGIIFFYSIKILSWLLKKIIFRFFVQYWYLILKTTKKSRISLVVIFFFFMSVASSKLRKAQHSYFHFAVIRVPCLLGQESKNIEIFLWMRCSGKIWERIHFK